MGTALSELKRVRQLCRALQEDDGALNNVATLLQVLERSGDEARTAGAACGALLMRATRATAPTRARACRAACAPRSPA